MSTKIKGNNWARKQFKQAIKRLDNFTLAGMPVLVSGTQFGRTLSNETQVQEAYHQSIFCPCLRGDEPPQKRFFDALLAGCIPVVLDYESDELGYRSYFAERTYSTRLSYPFATGIFAGKSDMGVHYEDLVVAINSTCNMECLLPTLEDLIQNHPEVIREKQANIARVASLFTYGINDNAFQYPDATAAILIQAKHYVDAVGR